jgi:cytochrome o ubiquinol oxidase operon protein cyoD
MSANDTAKARDVSYDVLVSAHQPENVSLRGYVIGFIASIILTLSAYLLTRHGGMSKGVLVVLLSGLAFSQFIVQLIYFLHIGKEFAPRLKLMMLAFMLTVVIILVGGSLWIMNNLSHRMNMPSVQQMTNYMKSQDNL